MKQPPGKRSAPTGKVRAQQTNGKKVIEDSKPVATLQALLAGRITEAKAAAVNEWLKAHDLQAFPLAPGKAKGGNKPREFADLWADRDCYKKAWSRLDLQRFDASALALSVHNGNRELCIDIDAAVPFRKQLLKDLTKAFPNAPLERSRSGKGSHLIVRVADKSAVVPYSYKVEGAAGDCKIKGLAGGELVYLTQDWVSGSLDTIPVVDEGALNEIFARYPGQAPTTVAAGDWSPPEEELDVEELGRFTAEAEARGIDITQGYNNWLKVAQALAYHLGEEGREYFHRLSLLSKEYNEGKANKQYSACVKAERRSGGDDKPKNTKRALFGMFKEAGISITTEDAPPSWEEDEKDDEAPKRGRPKRNILEKTPEAMRRLLRKEQAERAKEKFVALAGPFALKKTVSIWFGEEGVGKSPAAVELAECVSQGKDFLGNKTVKCGVMLIDLELPASLRAERYGDRRARYDIVDKEDMTGHFLNGGSKTKDKLAKLFAYIESSGVGLVIFDNLFSIANLLGISLESNANGAISLVKRFQALATKFDKAVVVIHHIRKQDKQSHGVGRRRALTLDDMWGSKAITALAESAVGIGRAEVGGLNLDGRSTWLYLKLLKDRFHLELETDKVYHCYLHGFPLQMRLYEREYESNVTLNHANNEVREKK